MHKESVNSGAQLRKARRLRLKREQFRERREPWYSPVLSVIAALLIWAMLYGGIHLASARLSAEQFFSPKGELIDQVVHLGPTNPETE